MSILEELSKDSVSSSPVRDARNWASILEALQAGFSLASIFRLLKGKGYPVGKGYSSFAAAVKYLQGHPPVENHIVPEPEQTNVGDSCLELPTVPQIEKSQTARSSFNPFADDRGGNDFGGE